MTVKTTGANAFAEALRRLADDIEAGNICSCSAMLDPTGLGRVSATFPHGLETDDEEPHEPTPSTVPGKRRRH